MSERTGLLKGGQTMYAGTPTNSTDGDGLLGREIMLKDRIRNWERVRVMRHVRNSSGAALLPKRAVKLSADGRTATGYALDGESNWALVDEQLPAAGVASNDIFLVCIKGPALALTPLSNVAADYAAGDLLSIITAATSGATTAGRVKLRPVTAATADATQFGRNVTENDAARARCLSAIVTNSTNTNILVDMRPI